MRKEITSEITFPTLYIVIIIIFFFYNFSFSNYFLCTKAYKFKEYIIGSITKLRMIDDQPKLFFKNGLIYSICVQIRNINYIVQIIIQACAYDTL